MSRLQLVREAAVDFLWELHSNARDNALKIALAAVCIFMLFAGAALAHLVGGEESVGMLVETRTDLRTVTVNTPPRTLTLAGKAGTSTKRGVVTRPGRTSTSTITAPRATAVVTTPGTTATRTVTGVQTVTVTLPGTTTKITETQTQTVTETQTVTVTMTETDCPGNSC